jgi:hypothetical protein
MARKVSGFMDCTGMFHDTKEEAEHREARISLQKTMQNAISFPDTLDKDRLFTFIEIHAEQIMSYCVKFLEKDQVVQDRRIGVEAPATEEILDAKPAKIKAKDEGNSD